MHFPAGFRIGKLLLYHPKAIQMISKMFNSSIFLKCSQTTRNPFKIGMKLEADHLKLGRGKIGVATIADVLDNRILIQFDGFDSSHDYWTDITSPNIHPYNWHRVNKSRLIPPRGLLATTLNK